MLCCFLLGGFFFFLFFPRETVTCRSWLNHCTPGTWIASTMSLPTGKVWSLLDNYKWFHIYSLATKRHIIKQDGPLPTGMHICSQRNLRDGSSISNYYSLFTHTIPGLFKFSSKETIIPRFVKALWTWPLVRDDHSLWWRARAATRAVDAQA